ncbi:MAG: hypothetical protein KDD62_16185, partial [Bdellovibrionales bacterium]|nr:hypothetical protein [Bdellovibrionales bacterium]
TADFTRLFRELQNTSVLSGEAESLLAFAAEQGVVHYFPRDRYQQMRIDAESDLRHYTSVREELGKDFRELKGRSSEMNARGSDISKAYADLEKESAELTARYYEVCQRKYGLFNRMVSGLKNIPLVGNLVEASSSLDAKLEEAKQSRVDAIKQQERELEQLIKGLESKDSLAKEVEKAKELLARADEDLNSARYHFTELDEFIETDRGYFRVLPEVKLLLELRSESARSADSAITIFNDHESLCHLIDKRVQEVTECQKHLVEFYSYPTLAAELVSWYISSSESTNLKQTISDFVDRNMDFADVVAPSYVQVFLSLNAPPGGLSIPEYAEELAYVSKDLPAFSRAERYFIGREMLKIEPEADSEPQERVMKLVNALTG